MSSFSRLCFISIAALVIGLAASAREVKAQAAGPHEVLINEFRLAGPGGVSDEFIEFYCNKDTDCDISNYVIQGFDPAFGDFTIGFPAAVIIPARQYLLIADTSQYSLPNYALPDFDLDFGIDFFIDNEGVQLLNDDESIVIDSVGFAGGGNQATYVEGTGLQRATAARPADQYAYVRKRGTATGGLPQDTDNNANDFVLVSVTGTAHTGITAPPVLGAPGPQALDSPASFNDAQITTSFVEPGVSSSLAPNRVRTGSGNSGTLSIRRSFTNNTPFAFDYLAFRVIDMTTLNSPNTLPGQAQLRLVTSGDAETFTNSLGRTVVIRGSILEFDDGTEPDQQNGGGLNTTVAVNLGQTLINPGDTVDVQFLLNVVQAGTFRFYVFAEAFPSAAPAADNSATASATRGGSGRSGRVSNRKSSPRRLIDRSGRVNAVLSDRPIVKQPRR